MAYETSLYTHALRIWVVHLLITGLFHSFTASGALSWLRCWTSNWINIYIYIKFKKTGLTSLLVPTQNSAVQARIKQTTQTWPQTHGSDCSKQTFDQTFLPGMRNWNTGMSRREIKVFDPQARQSHFRHDNWAGILHLASEHTCSRKSYWDTCTLEKPKKLKSVLFTLEQQEKAK